MIEVEEKECVNLTNDLLNMKSNRSKMILYYFRCLESEYEIITNEEKYFLENQVIRIENIGLHIRLMLEAYAYIRVLVVDNGDVERNIIKYGYLKGISNKLGSRKLKRLYKQLCDKHIHLTYTDGLFQPAFFKNKQYEMISNYMNSISRIRDSSHKMINHYISKCV